ncbi:hypothetical protein H2200_001830 [Cladophialophora chaetospira]|uniref:Ubiquitin-protein ligase sel1 n=1 Tax=Cladophialophora chaetospira TaxID=386627 RepID=A0AA38XLR7_9EURO|nr:hypothetical protein H2200_001830 [Cladophialophora chaetospira]
MGPLMITKRQDNGDKNTVCDFYGCYSYSPAAFAIKWAIVAAIFLLFSLYFVGGYLHAQRRMKKGLPPLAYHRWLVTRRQKAAFVAQYPQHAHLFPFYRAQQAQAGPYGYGYNQGQAYQMGGMYGAPAPPAYNEPDYVPAYPGPNKVDPNQHYNPPTGPPPPSTPATAPAAPEPARVVR